MYWRFIMNEIILQWAWYFLVVAIVIIFSGKLNTWLAIKKEANNINAYNIHVTTPHDDEAVKILDKLIEDTMTDYLLLNRVFKEKNFINSSEEQKIVHEVTNLVSSRISPIILDKLNFIYNEDAIYEVIGKKTYIRVMSYVMDNNRVINNK